ncbi:hypothetical protein ACFLIM_23985 [Nonomuraea sp. M3C6]|uniref:Uncharacterized protein n=1 Tax=Nonomuraea marmarensis TaxID=3351344 RepID=A0ABW7AIX7_9ACTN
MSDAEQHPHHHGLVERLREHHEQVVHRHEEEALEAAAGQAGFDLETDLGHPMLHHEGEAFDLEGDLGVDNSH